MTERSDANMRRLRAAIIAMDESGAVAPSIAEEIADAVRALLDSGELRARLDNLRTAEALTAGEHRDALSAYIEAQEWTQEWLRGREKP
jgi:hypothetical protein